MTSAPDDTTGTWIQKQALSSCSYCVVALCLYFVTLIIYLDSLTEVYQVSDLYNYWLITQQFLAGHNPYDYDLLLKASAHSGVGPANFGPWTLVILLPFLAGSFKTTVLVYFITMPMVLILLSSIGSKLFVRGLARREYSCWNGFLFAPAILNFFYGQWGILTAAFGYLALQKYLQQRYILSGAFLALATLKPHIGFLMWAALIITVVRGGKWQLLLSGLISFVFLNGVAEVIYPSITQLWMSSFHSSLAWPSASLVLPIRQFFATELDPHPFLPAIVVPCLALLLTLNITTRHGSEKFIQKMAPYLLVFSCLTAPYIWPSDYTVLIGLFIIVMSTPAQSYGRDSTNLNRCLALLAQILLVLQFCIPDYISKLSMYWFPVLLLYLWVRHNSRGESQDGSKHTN